MATNSFIGIEDKSGHVTGVYCHWDGHVDSVGAVLKEHYRDREKLKSLVSLGSLSTLGAEIGEQHEFESPDALKNNWTTAYHRDRGELFEIEKYDNMYEVSRRYEYAYVYTNQRYWLYRTNFGNSPWLPL